jgi:hypothetical protein
VGWGTSQTSDIRLCSRMQKAPAFRMVHHSIMSGGISLPKCTRTSTLELISVLVLHESVASIGGEHRCGMLIRLRRCAGYDPRFVRGVRAQCFTNFATKAFCTLRNNNWIAFCTLRNSNWIQFLFRKVQNAVVAKLVKHCALTNVNSDRGFES